ncbi:hypothetical protein Salat_1895700, partial [Sesamum alatum]
MPFPPTRTHQARRTIIPLHPQLTTVDIPPPPARDPPCLNDISTSAAAAIARVSSDSRFPTPAARVSPCNISSSTTASTSHNLSYSRVSTPPTAASSPPHSPAASPIYSPASHGLSPATCLTFKAKSDREFSLSAPTLAVAAAAMNGGSYLEALNRAQPPLAGNKSDLEVPNLLSNQPAPPPCMVALPPPLLPDNRNFSLGTYLSIRRRCSSKKQINLQQPLRIHH